MIDFSVPDFGEDDLDEDFDDDEQAADGGDLARVGDSSPCQQGKHFVYFGEKIYLVTGTKTPVTGLDLKDTLSRYYKKLLLA